jgi:hypothetical protein
LRGVFIRAETLGGVDFFRRPARAGKKTNRQGD